MIASRDSMNKRAADLRDLRNTILRQVEAGEISWKGAFEKIYSDAFDKLSRPVKREPRLK